MMFSRYKGIILAVILGVICPALVISVLVRKENEFPDNQKDATYPIEKRIDNSEHPISVLLSDGTVTTMGMDEYLVRVLLCEMPADFEIEAIKAQAVVARTYALRRSTMSTKHNDAAVCTDSDCCQGYMEIDDYLNNYGNQKDVDVIRDAVKNTDNLVLVYNGSLIDATYFSCSGGKTEDAKAVWGSDIPYLKSTESPGEERAAYYVDTVAFSKEDFLKKLNVSEEAKEYIRIEEISYTAGGGIDKINVCGQVFKGTQFRKMLGLRSTALYINIVGDTVSITTKGFGHRVGMSQYGADAMALRGFSFPDILAHYYNGTQLVTYNGN